MDGPAHDNQLLCPQERFGVLGGCESHVSQGSDGNDRDGVLGAFFQNAEYFFVGRGFRGCEVSRECRWLCGTCRPVCAVPVEKRPPRVCGREIRMLLLSAKKRTAGSLWERYRTYSFMDAVQAISTVEIVLRQALLLQGVLRANCNNGLGRLQGLEALGLSRSFAPGIFLFEHMKQCHNIAQTAARWEPCKSVFRAACRCRCFRPRNF